MSIQSQGAIKRCMKFLQIDPAARASTRVDATIEIRKYNRRGPMGVEFHPDVGEGPYLSLDNTIRDYGIRHGEFKPGGVRMRFDAKKGVLHLSLEEEYDFVLDFATERSA